MKKKLFIILGLLTVLAPLNLKAATKSINVSCDKTTIKAGESSTCNIKGKSDSVVMGFDFKVKLGEHLSIVESQQDKMWYGDSKAYEEGIDLHYAGAGEAGPGEFNIGYFVVKAGNVNGVTTTIDFLDAEFSNEDFTDTGINIKSISIRIPSTINTLNNLTVDNTLIEGFAADKTEYSFTVDSSKASVTIGATKTNESSKLTGDIGVKPLKYGMNTFKVVVTSESGAAKNYVVKINRPEIRELKTLTINETPVALDEGVYEYNINVENAITSLDIAAELANKEDVEFVKDFGPRTVKDLKVGTNEVLIKVDDNKGDVLTYKLVITRADGNYPNINNNVKEPSTGDNNYFLLILAVGALGGVSYIKLRKLNKASK